MQNFDKLKRLYLQQGKMSITRKFGYKLTKNYKEDSEIITYKPEIFSFKIKTGYEFLIIGNKGVFNSVSNLEIVKKVRSQFNSKTTKIKNVHLQCGQAVEEIMKMAFHREETTNVSCIMILLSDLIKSTKRIS